MLNPVWVSGPWELSIGILAINLIDPTASTPPTSAPANPTIKPSKINMPTNCGAENPSDFIMAISLLFSKTVVTRIFATPNPETTPTNATSEKTI